MRTFLASVDEEKLRRYGTAPQQDGLDWESILRREETLEVRLRSTETQSTYNICCRGGRRD